MRNQLFSPAVCLLTFLCVGLASCDTPTGLGAAAGAAGGAIIGAVATGRASGAAFGAANGALLGTLIGATVQQSDAEAYQQRPRDGYPVAERTDRKGIVISPYEPHHTIDVTEIPHGALVRDPSCNRLFVNP